MSADIDQFYDWLFTQSSDEPCLDPDCEYCYGTKQDDEVKYAQGKAKKLQ